MRLRFLDNIKVLHHQYSKSILRGLFWFSCGVLIGFFFFVSFVYIHYKNTYFDSVYSGVYVNGVDFGGKSKAEVLDYFNKKNQKIQQSSFNLTTNDNVATVSARELNFGYNASLLSEQVYSVGRSEDIISNVSLMLQAYMHGVYLPASYYYDEKKLFSVIEPMRKQIYKKPVEARFTVNNDRVEEFRESSFGQEVDIEAFKQRITAQTLSVVAASTPQRITVALPIKVLRPKVSTEEVNNLGIKELLASGTSLFVGSISNRIYNIALAATRLDGVLVKPGETFSFNKAIGDISTFTGYKQAYVIQNGRTVLGDGGGVCQVSTTFFRAVLNAGLPVVERNPHAYRVSYYEQDAGPGLDAAIYVPSVDFKFKNDTQNHILIQTVVDPDNGRLTFELYGTKDNREVEISKPVVTSVSSSPEPLYIDDPTLPKGEIKQIDYAVAGANVYFTRVVKQDGKVLHEDKFSSRYRPWQAVYQRGTKE